MWLESNPRSIKPHPGVTLVFTVGFIKFEADGIGCLDYLQTFYSVFELGFYV